MIAFVQPPLSQPRNHAKQLATALDALAASHLAAGESEQAISSAQEAVFVAKEGGHKQLYVYMGNLAHILMHGGTKAGIHEAHALLRQVCCSSVYLRHILTDIFRQHSWPLRAAITWH